MLTEVMETQAISGKQSLLKKRNPRNHGAVTHSIQVGFKPSSALQGVIRNKILGHSHDQTIFLVYIWV